MSITRFKIRLWENAPLRKKVPIVQIARKESGYEQEDHSSKWFYRQMTSVLSFPRRRESTIDNS